MGFPSQLVRFHARMETAYENDRVIFFYHSCELWPGPNVPVTGLDQQVAGGSRAIPVRRQGGVMLGNTPADLMKASAVVSMRHSMGFAGDAPAKRRKRARCS